MLSCDIWDPYEKVEETVLWDTVPYLVVNSYGRFGEANCIHFQDLWSKQFKVTIKI